MKINVKMKKFIEIILLKSVMNSNLLILSKISNSNILLIATKNKIGIKKIFTSKFFIFSIFKK